jgi:uncharacterized protein YjbI with pentapeptide repeats
LSCISWNDQWTGHGAYYTFFILEHSLETLRVLSMPINTTAKQGATRTHEKNTPMTMYIAAPIITVFLLLSTTGTPEAFDQADLDRLRGSKQCPKCDLSEANLSGAKLNRADLSGANLRNADLSWANLNGAGLVGTDLSHADLSNANLSWSDLRGANLTEATLTRANLTGAKLSGVTWTDGRECAEGSIGVCG